MHSRRILAIAALASLCAIAPGVAAATSRRTVMADSTANGRTIFRIKPQHIQLELYYKHVPEGYSPNQNEMYWGELVKLHWSSWNATRGTATGIFIASADESRSRVKVVLSRPVRARFTHLAAKGPHEDFAFPVYDASQDLWLCGFGC